MSAPPHRPRPFRRSNERAPEPPAPDRPADRSCSCFRTNIERERKSHLVYNFISEFGILRLTVESEAVDGFAVGHLVQAEPLDRGPQQAREVQFHVGHVVELGGDGVPGVDGDELPVGLALVDERERAEHLDGVHVAARGHARADVEHVDGVVVAARLRARVHVLRVLPRLRQRAVVPDVAVVREHVAHEAEGALLHVLLDRVEGFAETDLHFGVGPARNLHHHVDEPLGLVGPQRDIVQGRDRTALILCNTNTLID